MVDQLLHVALHGLALGRGDFVVLDHDRAGVVAQPLDALADDAVAFAQLGHTHQITVIAIAVHADGHVKSIKS